MGRRNLSTPAKKSRRIFLQSLKRNKYLVLKFICQSLDDLRKKTYYVLFYKIIILYMGVDEPKKVDDF